MEFRIKTLWDGDDIDHEPVIVRLESHPSGLTLNVDAPYFDDPKPPGGVAGQPFQKLWEYEVVEVFFLNDKDQYLEVEVSPHGQHLVLVLDGCRNLLQDMIPMEYEAKIEGNRWKGRALIPAEYFPHQVTKINCYAIHEQKDKRAFEALYPAPKGKQEEPDFHNLEYFQPANIQDLLPKDAAPCSKLWKS